MQVAVWFVMAKTNITLFSYNGVGYFRIKNKSVLGQKFITRATSVSRFIVAPYCGLQRCLLSTGVATMGVAKCLGEVVIKLWLNSLESFLTNDSGCETLCSLLIIILVSYFYLLSVLLSSILTKLSNCLPVFPVSCVVYRHATQSCFCTFIIFIYSTKYKYSGRHLL